MEVEVQEEAVDYLALEAEVDYLALDCLDMDCLAELDILGVLDYLEPQRCLQ